MEMGECGAPRRSMASDLHHHGRLNRALTYGLLVSLSSTITSLRYPAHTQKCVRLNLSSHAQSCAHDRKTQTGLCRGLQT